MVDTVSVFRLELLCVPCIDCAFTPQKSRQPVPFASSPVSLERCKTDENGRAIHEDCYVRKICSSILNRRVDLRSDSPL
jgi:hypothetical protein